jgi:hypothetical protein
MDTPKTLTPIQKIYAVIIMSLFAAPNIYYMVTGGEDFPFTSAPMFGHYIGKGTQFYSFRFIGEFDGVEKVLPPRLGKNSEIATLRFFFSKIYGSCEELSPFGNHPDDSSRRLEERLATYFKGYLAALPEAGYTDINGLQRIRLEVWRYNSQDEVDAKHVVGRYTISTEKFMHQWPPQ